MLSFHLEAPGVAAPGLEGWAAACPVLLAQRRYRPEPMADYAPEILPATARRRGSRSTRLAVQVAQESLANSVCSAADTAAVFASSTGDPEITDQLCRTLALPEPTVSPTRFHNSVHNAPAGYWSIATGSRQSTSSLAGYDASFSAGLLSAAVQVCTEGGPVMLVAFDLLYPEPLRRFRRLAAPFATALILTPQQTERSLLHCRLTVSAAAASATGLPIPELEALRVGNPAARALPILARLANPSPERITLEYLTEIGLILECAPC